MDEQNLLIIGPTPPPYHGVAVAIRGLLDSRITERFTVHHLELADRRGIQYVNKPDLHDVLLFLKQWIRLVVILLRARPRLTYFVLSQTTIGFLRDSFLFWPAYLMGSRIVLHLHGGNFRHWLLERSWLMRVYVRTVMKRVTRAIVLGESLRAQFSELVSKEDIAVVANGVPSQPNNRSLGARNGRLPCRVLHLSTLSHLKGALVILQAVPLVMERCQSVEFILAGLWSHQEDRVWADDFIARHNLEKHVCFTGQVEGDQKDGLFESASIFAFPGIQQEGQPLVILEAMAAGLPVIYTNRGCLRDTVIDGEAGLEVPINDPAGLADRILWLVDHPDEMLAMGIRARRRYEALYTRQHHIENMIDVFASSCTGKVA